MSDNGHPAGAKSPPAVHRYGALKFNPRFEYGHMAEIAEVCGSGDGSELGTGIARFSNARIPWTIRYDEVLTVLQGELRVQTGEELHTLGTWDSLWLPAGTELVYEADSAIVSYAIHPSNWSDS